MGKTAHSLRHRETATVTLAKVSYERLMKWSKETGLPMSRIMDILVAQFKDNEIEVRFMPKENTE